MFSTTGLFSTHGRPLGASTRLLWAYRGSPQIWAGWTEPFEASSAVFFVENGKVEVEHEGGVAVVEKGDLFFGAAGVRRQRIDTGTRLLSVGYEALWLNGRPIYAKGLNRVLAGGVLNGQGRALHEASVALVGGLFPGRSRVDFLDAARQPTPASSSWVERQVAFWAWFGTLQTLLKSQGVEPMLPVAATTVVRQVQAHLDTRPLDAPLAAVADELSLPVGWRRVQQLFRHELHVTPQHYFEARRLEAARKKLLDPAVAVKVVALELGFRSASHFSDWFRRGTGLSPRQLRPEGT